MSKFSVGQRVQTTRDFAVRFNAAFKSFELNMPETALSATVVSHEFRGTIVRLDLEGYETPSTALKLGGWRKDGWFANDGELAPLHRFFVNDKVTIKRNGLVGVVDDIDEVDQERPYVVTVLFEDGEKRYYFVSDDDLDPYVEPPTPATADDNPRLIALIEERLAKGFASYGHGVQTGDRQYDWPTMTLEEMLDGAIYLAAAIVRLQDADRQHRIDSHYIAVARELATINGWTITNALDALVVGGFATSFYNDPDAYLSDEPRELARGIDEKRKGAK
jgi:hypothetical protein